MSESSRRFNFDDFDAQIAEALDDHEDFKKVLRPGCIGSVPVRLTSELDLDVALYDAVLLPELEAE